MATLKTIRKRISSTENTKKLTHAMKMIATSRMRRAQQKVLEARVFKEESTRLLKEVLKRVRELSHPLVRAKEKLTGYNDLFVITSDRGLCGAFNEHLLKHVVKNTKQNTRLYVFGKKGEQFFRRQGIHVEKACRFENINEEMVDAIERYTNDSTDGVSVIFNRFKNVGSSEIALARLLPASPPDVEPEYSVDYIYEPDATDILDRLIRDFIRAGFFTTFLESSAAELAARMIAMDKASKNAEDLILSLTQVYNKARQASITKELIDIVGGAEALK